jgi:hypothetical protein
MVGTTGEAEGDANDIAVVSVAAAEVSNVVAVAGLEASAATGAAEGLLVSDGLAPQAAIMMLRSMIGSVRRYCDIARNSLHCIQHKHAALTCCLLPTTTQRPPTHAGHVHGWGPPMTTGFV